MNSMQFDCVLSLCSQKIMCVLFFFHIEIELSSIDLGWLNLDMHPNSVHLIVMFVHYNAQCTDFHFGVE